MSYYIYETYPVSSGAEPYYVEFLQFNKENPLQWNLFKRNFFCSEEEWAKLGNHPMISREVHPWNLGGGTVCETPNVISMNTKEFLIFLVDSLNNYSNKK